MKYLLTLLIFLSLSSCNDKADQNQEGSNEPTEEASYHDEADHHHEAPNGGVLTELGEHAASLEWLIEDGVFKIYVFDGCAEEAIRLTQKEIKITVKTDEEKQLVLTPITNKLTGEKPGDSNTFTASISDLSQEKISSIFVQSVTIQGIDYNNVNLMVE